MDAHRLKSARSALWRAWVFGGLLSSVIFLCTAAAVLGIFGLKLTSYYGTLVLVAVIMAGGAYGILLFGSLLIYTFKRVMRGQPIVEED